jgi:hypothetical protein
VTVPCPCWGLPSSLPGAFAETCSRAARLVCSETVLGDPRDSGIAIHHVVSSQASHDSGHGHPRHREAAATRSFSWPARSFSRVDRSIRRARARALRGGAGTSSRARAIGWSLRRSLEDRQAGLLGARCACARAPKPGRSGGGARGRGSRVLAARDPPHAARSAQRPRRRCRLSRLAPRSVRRFAAWNTCTPGCTGGCRGARKSVPRMRSRANKEGRRLSCPLHATRPPQSHSASQTSP